MGLFGSLFTGTSGLMAQSNATANVSTNIANSTTVGFKKADIGFYDLVANRQQTSVTNGVINGIVTTTRVQRLEQQGAIRQTGVTTDAAINGNGFFAVKRIADDSAPLLFTRNGQFDVSVEGEGTSTAGYLRNSAGLLLYGVELDQNGESPATITPQSLVPIDVSPFTEVARPTTQVTTLLTVDAEQAPYDTHRLGTGAQQLPVDNQTAHFTRDIVIFDGEGNQQAITYEFRKIVGPMGHFTSNLATQMAFDDVLVDNATGPTPNITAGDTFVVSDGASTLTVDFVNGPADRTLNQANTVSDLVNVISDFNGGNSFDAEIYNGQLLVRAVDPTATLDLSATAAGVRGAAGFNIVPDPDGADFTFEPDASITGASAAYPDQGQFPTLGNDQNTRNWWEFRIVTQDPTPGSTALIEQTKGLLNFNGDGTLNIERDADGNPLNPAILTITNLDFNNSTVELDGNGNPVLDENGIPIPRSAAADDLASITVDITGFSQFAGGYNVLDTTQNGAPIGQRTGISIDREGFVIASFSNGLEQRTHKIPIANFVNENGLQEVSGTAYRETQDSGLAAFFDAGLGGTGFLAEASIENSNVDIADEFAHLIVSQRAFSANSRLINTVDEMTQNLARLKR